MANTRRLYHDSGCRYVEIGPKDKSDCAQCRGAALETRISGAINAMGTAGSGITAGTLSHPTL